MENESVSQLIAEAIQMYRDRPRQESDLIYYIAKMEEKERIALILGYELVYKDESK